MTYCCRPGIVAALLRLCCPPPCLGRVGLELRSSHCLLLLAEQSIPQTQLFPVITPVFPPIAHFCLLPIPAALRERLNAQAAAAAAAACGSGDGIQQQSRQQYAHACVASFHCFMN